MPIEVTDVSFEKEVLQSKLPVVVDLWAEWCGSCKNLTKILEDVEKWYDGKVKVVTIDVGVNQSTAQQYNVSSMPTLLFIKNGKLVSQIIGLRSRTELTKLFDGLIN